MEDQSQQAHVCGTEPQGEAVEEKKDKKEKHSHSLPAHGGAATVMGRFCATAGSFFGVTGMAPRDRSEMDLYHALRRQTNKIYRHLNTLEIRHFYFKEKIYISIQCI